MRTDSHKYDLDLLDETEMRNRRMPELTGFLHLTHTAKKPYFPIPKPWVEGSNPFTRSSFLQAFSKTLNAFLLDPGEFLFARA